MDVILVNFGVNYAVDCIKHAQCTSELKQLATLTNEGELDIFSFHGETFRKVVLHGVTAFRWCEDGKSETTDQKFVAITKDEVCFYSTNFAKIGPSDLLKCKHKVIFDDLQNTIRSRGWVCCETPSVQILDYENNMCTICIHAYVAHFSVTSTCIALQSLYEIAIPANGSGEHVLATDSFVYSLIVATGVLYVYDKENGYLTSAVNVLEFIANCSQNGQVVLDQQAHYAILESDSLLVLVDSEKNAHCMDLNKIYIASSTSVSNDLGVGSISTLESMRHSSEDKISQYSMQEMSPRFCANDSSGRFLPFWISSRKKTSRRLTGFGEKESGSLCFNKNLVNRQDCITIPTTRSVRAIDVCSAVFSVWAQGSTDDYGDLLIINMETGSVISSLRFQKPTYVLLSHKSNLPHILIHQNYISAFSYAVSQEEIVNQFMLYANAAAADYLARMNCWDCISMPLNVLELGLKNHQLDAVSFFLKSHDDDFALSDKSVLDVSHLQNVLCLLTSSIKECSLERGSHNFAEQLLQLTLNYLNRVLRAAVTTSTASLSEDVPDFERLTSSKIVELAVQYLIELRSFLKDYPKPSTQSNSEDINDIQTRLEVFPSVLDAWNRWSKLSKEEVIQDAVWNECLPLAHFFCVKQFELPNYTERFFHHCRDIILDSVIDCLRQSNIPRATILLENFGLTSSEFLKMLMFNTAHRPLRMIIEEELKKQGVFSEAEEKLLHFYSLVEEAYPCQSFTKAREMLDNMVLHETSCWHECFSSPLSSSLASLSFSTYPEETLSFTASWVSVNECDNWESLDYSCLLLAWTTSWSQEIWERVISEKSLLKNDSGLPKNSPSSTAFWDYLLQHGHLYDLLNWVKKSCGNECDSEILPWPISTNMVENVGLHAAPHIANCVLDELARYGIFSFHEIDDFMLCIKRLVTCGVKKMQLVCLSLPHSSVTLDEFLKKFAIMCVDNCLAHVLYNYMEQLSATNELLESQEELANPSWFKMMIQFKNWVSHPEDCEAVFQASLYAAEYILKQCCSKPDDILQAGDAITGLATLLYNPGIADTINQEILKLCADDSTLHSVAFSVRSSEIASPQDINVYRLLQGRIPYDVTYLFGWQATNGLKAPDASTELPYFSHPALVKQHGVLQVLDFTLYIKQGRPSFAYAKFIIHCIQKFGTVSPKQIRDACNHAHSIALQHFYSKPVASASVAFMKMLNYKTRGLRIDLEVSQLILTHSNSQIPKLITGQKRDAALKKNQDEIALLLRASVLGQRNSLSKMLELLEESVVAKLKADKIESTSVEACYRWNLVVLFCKRYNLPLTVMFLKVCSLAGDWVMFVFFAEIHKYPKHLILNLSTHYPNKQMVQHLKNAFAQLRSSSVIATQLNGKSKPRDVRASLYSKIGVKTSRKDEKEIAVKLGSCSDDDIKNAPSKAESSDDLTDYSGSSSLTSFEAVPDTLTNDLPADLLSVILYCHQQPCSWHSVLNHAVLLKNPVLAAIAACYKDASVIQCMCVWLLITARGHLWETLSQQASNCFSWDSEDLQTIIVEIMHLKLFHVLTEGLYYFQPDCPLYPLMRFVKDFLLEKSYEGSFAFFTEFQSKMKNLADGFSDCEIGTNEWLKKMTVVIINESFLSITNPFERLKFLKIICDCDVFRSQRSIDNLPDYHLLFRVQELLSSTHVTFNETNLLKPLHDSCHSMECLRIFHCLLQEKQISLAYKFADISSLPKSAVLIFQMQEELSVLEMCPSKNNLHTKLSVWKHCFVLFKENDVPVLEIAKFCKTMVQSYKSSEKYFVLYLAWLMSNPLLPAWSIACEYDEELEREMWLARITAEQEGEDDEFMDIGEVITNLTVFQQNILLLPTARHKTSQCIIQAATNNLNFRQLEWSLKNDKERTALTKIIYQLLDQGQICIAYRLSLLFKQKCDALSIILTCMKLAEGVMPLNEVEMDLRLLLEQGSPVKSHVLSSRFLNPVMTRNSSSVYSLSSLSSVLDTSYDAMTKLESSLEKMAIPQNDVSIAMENLLSRCEAGGLLCISIITLHKIAQVLDVGYMEIMENWNDAQLLKALLQCDAIDRFILAKDYILSYGICDAFIVSFLCDQIVCALRVFTGNATDEDQLLRSSRELILKPTESSAMFFQLVNLCSDPSLLGYRLLELSEPASSDENGYLPLKVELCIHAHSCFAVAVHVEGIAHCLQKVRILSKRLAKTGEFSLMVSLLVGIGRFSEMSYIFDILRENHQFELLFRKGMEKVPNLKTALLDYMCRFHPSDNETLTMIALHFRMYREIAKMLEDSARKQVDHFIFSGYAEQKNPLELLENIMQFFADAAESYTKAECIQHALQCVKQAELIALQIYLLPVGIIILNMSAAQVSEFIVNHQNVYESLIVAEAYNQHQDWSQALYVNFVMKSSVDYLRDFCHKIGLSTGILEEIVTRYKKDGNRTNQMSSNMWQILHCLEDVQMKYELAIQLEFHEFAVKLLHKESAQILKDHVQVRIQI